jgi:hypothetical protein
VRSNGYGTSTPVVLGTSQGDIFGRTRTTNGYALLLRRFWKRKNTLQHYYATSRAIYRECERSRPLAIPTAQLVWWTSQPICRAGAKILDPPREALRLTLTSYGAAFSCFGRKLAFNNNNLYRYRYVVYVPVCTACKNVVRKQWAEKIFRPLIIDRG